MYLGYSEILILILKRFYINTTSLNKFVGWLIGGVAMQSSISFIGSTNFKKKSGKISWQSEDYVTSYKGSNDAATSEFF